MRQMSDSRAALSLITSFALAACGGRATSLGAIGGAGGDSEAGGAASALGGAGSPLAGDGAAPSAGASCDSWVPGGSAGAASPEAGADAGDAASTAGSTGSSGSAGEAGLGTAGGSADACSSRTWTASASVSCAPDGGCPGWPTQPQTAAQAIDGDPSTRYTTGRAQTGNEEFVVSFPATVTLNGISLSSVDFGTGENDGPALYAVEYSTDSVLFMPFEPPIMGSGLEALPTPYTGGWFGSNELSIPFPATSMRAIRVKQTGTKGWWWSIREFGVAGCRSD